MVWAGTRGAGETAGVRERTSGKLMVGDAQGPRRPNAGCQRWLAAIGEARKRTCAAWMARPTRWARQCRDQPHRFGCQTPIHRVAVQLRGSTTDDLAPVQNVIVIGLPALFIATVAGVPCLTPSTLSHLGLASNASQ